MTRRILHISDLHFGRTRPELVTPLVRRINDLSPDLVVASGDFTQRARVSQYIQARDFLDRLDPPVLSVPGNHDTPLDNVLVRFFRPWARYRRYIHPDLEPQFRDGRMTVLGVNSVNHFSWQRGRIRRSAVARVCDAVDRDGPGRMQILVLHHPLEQPEDSHKRLSRGAARALGALAECGTDIVLSGHLHTWHAAPFLTQGGVLLVQAGTSLSTRVRDEPNDFNLLTLGDDWVTVERFAASGDAMEFHPILAARYEKADGAWHRLS